MLAGYAETKRTKLKAAIEKLTVEYFVEWLQRHSNTRRLRPRLPKSQLLQCTTK